jgi:hypothetical protein
MRIQRDTSETRMAASRVNAKVSAGDSAATYHESAPRFKTVGSESEFVARLKAIEASLGQLMGADEISYRAGVDASRGRTYQLALLPVAEKAYIQSTTMSETELRANRRLHPRLRRVIRPDLSTLLRVARENQPCGLALF